MKAFRHLAIALTAVAFICNGALAATTSELLQQGLYAEEVEGNIDSAIKTYGQVIKNKSASPAHVAQALYRQGMCYLKIKDEASARTALEKLVAEHSTQTELVDKARPVLDDLTDFDPAALMPPGTLMYVEFGSPGRQIETILTMLKDTPFENPLAAMRGPRSNNGNQKSPGDILGALLNPSMMAEFKKIRSSAVGLIGKGQGHPHMIAVLYPGKSDALRGLILAGLGMAGTTGNPIEGLSVVNLPEDMAVAYDDKIVLMARPASQLQWCVKQYKRLSSEPTLASSNKSFAKLNKNLRQKNVLTVWANVDEGYDQVLKMFPPGQVPPQLLSANAFADFHNIDDLIFTESVETTGIGSRLEFQFKDGHRCLAYGMIRTPNISKAALEAVPADAVAVASFSLSQAGPQTEQVRAQVQTMTGLDIGREIFANIEQVTIFVLPTSATGSAPNTLLPGCLGVAITSRNPEQTKQVLTTLLATADPAATPQQGRYKVGASGGQDIYCHLEQVNKTTLLALNPDVLRASVATLKNHKSAAVAGPLQKSIGNLTPATSKLILVNAGGAIRLFGPLLKTHGLAEAQLKDWSTSLEQLAHATEATTLELRTDEQPNGFAANVSLNGIPPLNQILGPMTQISHLSDQAQAKVAAKKLQQAKPATLRQANQTPVIDGKPDGVWNTAESYKLDNVLTAWPSASNHLAADFKALWDDKNLYVLVDVTDRVLCRDAEVSWQFNDGIELYLDGDNAKASEFGQNDYQYSFNWDATTPEMKEHRHERTEGVKYSLVTTDKGYCLEAAFPWTTLGVKPSAGAKIGLDVQVNDNQGNKKRDGKISWHDENNRAWKTPQAFGNAELAGLIGWWKFDETEGKTAKDSSGGNHNGTLVGNAKWAKGKHGGAIDLDGAGSFVRIADEAAFDMGGAITLASWVNIRSVPTGWMGIVTKGDSAWRLSTSDQLRKFHFAFNTGPNSIRADAEHVVGANEWHHVAAVYDGRAMHLYVDGKLDGTQPWNGVISATDADVLIGENVEQPNRCFDGLIDDVRIYNYALPENEIKALAAEQIAAR